MRVVIYDLDHSIFNRGGAEFAEEGNLILFSFYETAFLRVLRASAVQ